MESFRSKKSIPADLTGLPAPSEFIPNIDSGFSDFDILTRRLMQWVADEAILMQKERSSADLVWLERLAQLVSEKTHFPQSVRDPRHACLVKCFMVKAPQPAKENELGAQENAPEATDDLLNSFFIQELQELDSAWRRQNIGQGFVQYMTAVAVTGSPRIDIRSEQGLRAALPMLVADASACRLLAFSAPVSL